MPKTSQSLGIQQSLFGIGQFEVGRIEQAMALDIRECSLSRQQIADYLTAHLGRGVTVSMLNDWTAVSKPHTPSLVQALSFVAVTHGRHTAEAIAAISGLHLINDDDHDLLEIARLREQREEIDQRLNVLTTRRRARRHA